MNKFLLANITWNPSGWRDNNYINPRAGHKHAREHVAGESLNFKFNKKSIDTKKYIHGFIQWTNRPVNFINGGLIIFLQIILTLIKVKSLGFMERQKFLKTIKAKKSLFKKVIIYLT